VVQGGKQVMQKSLVRKGLVLGIILLFVGATAVPNIPSLKIGKNYIDSPVETTNTDLDKVDVSEVNDDEKQMHLKFPIETIQKVFLKLQENKTDIYRIESDSNLGRAIPLDFPLGFFKLDHFFIFADIFFKGLTPETRIYKNGKLFKTVHGPHELIVLGLGYINKEKKPINYKVELIAFSPFEPRIK
jgi:hypothetical protein